MGPPVNVELDNNGPLGIKHVVGGSRTFEADDDAGWEKASRSREPVSENSRSYSRNVSRETSDNEEERR